MTTTANPNTIDKPQSPDSPNSPAGRRGRVGQRRRCFTALMSALALATFMSGCTMSEGNQYRVDIQPWGTLYVHIYQVPSFGMILLRDTHCRGNIDCTANFLRANVNVSGPAKMVWNYALNNRQELYNAISVSKASYNPKTGWLQCVMIYSVWTTGWGNSSDPQWCKHG